MRQFLTSLTLALFLAASVAFAQTPTFTLVNTGLDATLGNAGKGVLDPQVAGFTGIAYGNGLFVAVAASTDESVIRWATSADGTTWTARSQAIPAGSTTYQTSKVHFLGGKFVFFTGFGDNGSGSTYCYTSTDGLTWTGNKVTSGRANIVEFDGGGSLFVAAGTNGRQFASSDLVTWTARPVVPNAAGFDHLDLAYGAGKFFSSINGFGGTTYSSVDAVTWTAIPATAAIGGSQVEAGNGVVLFNASTDRFRSTDGTTIAKYTATLPANYVTGSSPRFTSGGFVMTAINFATGKSAYLLSADGITWTTLAFYSEAPPQPAGQSRVYFHTDIAYGNGKYVIAGQDISQTLTSKTTLPLIMVVEAGAAPAPPVITAAPVATTGVLGGKAVFGVTATGAASYQWRKDGVAIAGATSATLTLDGLTAASAGNYSVVVTNAVGSVTSTAVPLTLVSASDRGRLINMSIRTNAGTGDNTLIVGIALGGANTSGPKPILVRGVGPTLSSFGVAGAIADPILTAYQGTTVIAQNDDWAGGFDFASVGAFAFAGTAPKDAAIFNAAIPVGAYSIQITGKNNGTGVALAEIYDATPAASFAASTPRLVNVSARTQVGTGDNILIAGFVVGGSSPVRVLVRAAGPALSAFGVGGVLANPKLELYSGTAKIAENDDWQGTAELKAAASSVGAFGFANDTSRDAALVATLSPGSYTAQISGVGSTSGVALVELYELP